MRMMVRTLTMMMMTMMLAEWVVVLVCAGDDGEDDGDDDGDDNVDVDKCPSGRHQPPTHKPCNPKALKARKTNDRNPWLAQTYPRSASLLLHCSTATVVGCEACIDKSKSAFSHPEALHACPARTVARLCRRNCFCFYVCFPVNICSFSHYTV